MVNNNKQQEQQLKLFLGLWPMATDKKEHACAQQGSRPKENLFQELQFMN